MSVLRDAVLDYIDEEMAPIGLFNDDRRHFAFLRMERLARRPERVTVRQSITGSVDALTVRRIAAFAVSRRIVV